MLLMAMVLFFIPQRYKHILNPLFPSADNSKTLTSKTDRSASNHRENKRRAPRRDPKEWFAEVRARNPGLEPVWRDVPDHENGFLQWLAFYQKHQVDGGIGTGTLGIPADIADMISHPEKWDSQAVKAFLDENKDLLETLARIGLLPSQSVAGIDLARWDFVGARLPKQCAELLLADARVAAEAGDFDHALRQVRAGSGLAGHFDRIEAPTLLMATVSTILRLIIHEQVMSHFLPALNGNAGEIARWREAIQSPNMQPSGFASILRGEGWVSLGGLVIAWAGGDESFPTDGDALFDAYAQGYIEAANRAQTLSLDDLLGGETHLGFPIAAGHLSIGAQNLLGEMTGGVSSWAKGWTRRIVLSARTDAALAIMQGAEIPPEPFTGLPYIYDPIARTLQVPDDPRLREILKIGAPLQLPPAE